MKHNMNNGNNNMSNNKQFLKCQPGKSQKAMDDNDKNNDDD